MMKPIKQLNLTDKERPHRNLEQIRVTTKGLPHHPPAMTTLSTQEDTDGYFLPHLLPVMKIYGA
jgi:hypothetical protein